ncbi:hypothetical protein [Methylomicrobium lacus]
MKVLKEAMKKAAYSGVSRRMFLAPHFYGGCWLLSSESRFD